MTIELAIITLPQRTAIYWDASRILRNDYADVERRRRALHALGVLARQDPSDHLRRAARAAIASLNLDVNVLLRPDDDPYGTGPKGVGSQDGAA